MSRRGNGERGFHPHYFGGRILNLLQMITGELEGRSGKSVRVSELCSRACCRPACLSGFLSFSVFLGLWGDEKKKPRGSRQEVPAPRIKVCHCDVQPTWPTPSTGSTLLPYIVFDSLVRQAHTAQSLEPTGHRMFRGIRDISLCAR